MTEKEKIRLWAKGRLFEVINGIGEQDAKSVLTDLISFLESELESDLTHSVTKISDQEIPISEDLENEIARWEDSFKHCPASMGYKETAIHFANWQKNHIWTEESEKIIRKKLENDYSQANSMVIWASRSDKPFDKDEELIMVKESANTIIKLIKKEIGV